MSVPDLELLRAHVAGYARPKPRRRPRNSIVVALDAAWRALDRASATVAYADKWVAPAQDRVREALRTLGLDVPRVPEDYDES